MKTLDERLKSVSEKIEMLQNKRLRRRFITRVCWIIALIILALILFIPYPTKTPDVSMYAESPYYSLIQYLNEALCEKPAYANNFEWLAAKADQLFYWLVAAGRGWDTKIEDWALNPQTQFVSTSADDILDDLSGTILDGELVHGDAYIYYFDKGVLAVFSAAGTDSKLAAVYRIEGTDGLVISTDRMGMYLSGDQKILHIVAEYKDPAASESYTGIIDLDVSDPEHIKEVDRTYITGSLITASMDEEDILVTVQFDFSNRVDFSDESTFLPQTGKPGAMVSVAAEDVILPGQLSDTCYTLVCRLDGTTLAVQGSCALLSYSGVVQVSDNGIYAARVYWEEFDSGLTLGEYTMTEITALSGMDGSWDCVNRIQLEGAVKGPSFLNEYNGVLRAVTMLLERKWIAFGYGCDCDQDWTYEDTSLYCISLDSWKVIASVQDILRYEAGTVRFAGDSVYLFRTSEVKSLEDVVYGLDLRDPDNMTGKDTIYWEAYSDILTVFGDYLVEFNTVKANCTDKVTVYRETEVGLEDVCCYTDGYVFSKDRDAYLIDEENQVIGLSTYGKGSDADEISRYVLLRFNGTRLQQICSIPIDAREGDVWAVSIGGYVYIFDGKALKTKKVG